LPASPPAHWILSARTHQLPDSTPLLVLCQSALSGLIPDPTTCARDGRPGGDRGSFFFHSSPALILSCSPSACLLPCLPSSVVITLLSTVLLGSTPHVDRQALDLCARLTGAPKVWWMIQQVGYSQLFVWHAVLTNDKHLTFFIFVPLKILIHCTSAAA
jgi:hypothetical protein